MGKEIRKRLMPLLVTLILLLSIFVLVPQNALAAPAIDEVSKDTDLTCGETIWVNASGLTEDDRYYVFVENETGMWGDNVGDDRADEDGEISVELNVPYRSALGSYTLSLHNSSNPSVAAQQVANETLDIDHIYDVKYKVGNQWLDYAIYNKSYEYPNAFYFYVYNWTGTKYELFQDSVTITLYDPTGVIEHSDTISTGEWDIDYTFEYGTGAGNLENEYRVGVVNDADASLNSNQTLPVKLNISAVMPTNLEWGDDIEISNGYIRDGAGNGIGNYNVSLYTTTEGGYSLVQYTSTYSTGRFSLIAPTDEKGGSAGKWYLGTWEGGGAPRVDETDTLDIAGFIKYYIINVDSDDSAKVKVESPDEIVSGFNQTINVSVYNSWDDDYYDEMWIHVTGIESWNESTLTEYNDDDVVVVHTNTADGYNSNMKYAYYEFSIRFNETGTGEIIVTFPNNDTTYEDLDDLKANITGSTNFEVISPGDMTVIVEDMVEDVNVNTVDPCAWINESKTITIQIFGDSQDDPMNASITITGAGLDIDIDEEDAESDGYLTPPNWGIYQIDVAPKTAGTVTITAKNDTENISVIKDFAVKGLSGTVTTSIGDDKEIQVSSTETIIAQITNGQYAEVHLTYYDENWIELDCLNETIGDDTAGNGATGRFEFIITDEDIEDGVGYIVVAAAAGDYFMYEIIEVAPVHDLVIEIIEPDDALNQTLTVGLEHAWEFEIYDGNGEKVDDIDDVIAEILDEDGDVQQTEDLKIKSGDIWYMDDYIPHFLGDLVITAVNNTGENEHDGNVTLDTARAEVTYSPDKVTCGIELENITVDVTVIDANGNPPPDGTKLYLNLHDAAGTDYTPNDYIVLDEDGMGDFEIKEVGDAKGKINSTFQSEYTNYEGNLTDGEFGIVFPNFIIEPPIIFIGQPNTVTITTLDSNNNPIEGVNITLIASSKGIIDSQPDPVRTNADGKVILSVAPDASGYLNVTIARDIKYVGGILNWTNAVVTNSTIEVTGKQALVITVSKSPVFQGETLTVTIKTAGIPVSGVDVEFGQVTSPTDANGEVDFTVPDPGVESAVYTITAKKTGYDTEEKTISVIKRYTITITEPTADAQTGAKFTVTILAKGSTLAGATVTFDGATKTSDGNGKVSFTAPSEAGSYEITASYENYIDGKLTIKIKAGQIPGFELLTLIAAIGVALILLKRRRH